MPELVALFNGSGGAASAVVALAEYLRQDASALRVDTTVAIALSVLIGMITLTGSLVAFGKLRGMTIGGVRLGNPLTFPMQHALNALLFLVVVGLGYVIAVNTGAWWALVLLTVIATLLGVLLTVPIGGADMPVVVSLLNSYSGLAACATGFVLDNSGLIIAGSLVGASGLILTKIMCKAMNRSLLNVLLGGFGQDLATAGSTTAAEGLTVRQMDAEEAVMLLEVAQKVVIIPGYGMAAAQAQHTVAEMADLLTKRGVDVKYGIHPVAGRMPGHMNVLLAEANVPYEQLCDLDLDSEMDQTDVVMVIGANDVVNPEADMPIFHVYKSKTVMVFKRSLNPGFAGIQNPLFFNENTVMLFGDAKKMVNQIVSELKELYSPAPGTQTEPRPPEIRAPSHCSSWHPAR
jgi:NAD(P) transhydrogenase subunit beta